MYHYQEIEYSLFLECKCSFRKALPVTVEITDSTRDFLDASVKICILRKGCLPWPYTPTKLLNDVIR